jgi:competence ComEA-like helix-hairpin-helix protein
VTRPRSVTETSGHCGSALIAVLWSLVLLSVVVLSSLGTTRNEIRLVKNHADSVQAYYLAVAGVEKAKALLYHQRRDDRSQGVSSSSRLFDDARSFRDVRFGRGFFRVVRQAAEDEDRRGLVYGVRDEEGRLDVNLASAEELQRLPGMTPEVAAAIADWRDDDARPGSGGAEQELYSTLVPPYRARNAPFETLRELLMVHGVSPQLVLGEDSNADGLLEVEEDDGPRSPPADDGDGVLDGGWSALLTLESSAPNLNARGKRRVNVSSADAETLATVSGISSDLARSIVAYREQRAIENLGQLLDVVEIPKQAPAQAQQPSTALQQGQPAPDQPAAVTAVQPLAAPAAPGAATAATLEGVANAPPQGATATPNPSGPKLISAALLKEIADEVTTSDDAEIAGAVNINTAPAAVFACLNGISQDLAAAIVSHRRQNGPFRSVADLLDVPGVTEDLFKQVVPRLAVRSGTYRIVAEGLVPSTGARRRLEVVVRLGEYDFETLAYREEP